MLLVLHELTLLPSCLTTLFSTRLMSSGCIVPHVSQFLSSTDLFPGLTS